MTYEPKIMELPTLDVYAGYIFKNKHITYMKQNNFYLREKNSNINEIYLK